jgi:hypothetical protein
MEGGNARRRRFRSLSKRHDTTPGLQAASDAHCLRDHHHTLINCSAVRQKRKTIVGPVVRLFSFTVNLYQAELRLKAEPDQESP